MQKTSWPAVLLVLAASLCIQGCSAKKIPLSDARYTGDVLVASEQSVSVTAETFVPGPETVSTLVAAAGIYVPVTVKVKDAFLFAPSDQLALAGILEQELVRLKVFRDVSGEAGDGARIHLAFKDGAYKGTINEYALTFEMSIEDARGKTLRKTYTINSNEQSTGWQALNTSVWKGKMQTVQVALDRLIPDIQAYLQGE